MLSRLKIASLTRMAESISIKLPPNPKLTAGMVLKIPESSGLPLSRPEPPAPTAKTALSGSFPATTAKTEPSEEGLSANPARSAARDALENGEFVLALSTVERFLGQNPRNGDATNLRRTVLLQQGRTLMEQNDCWTPKARPTNCLK